MSLDDFSTDKQITSQRANSATQWIIDNAETLAQAKAQRDRCEHMLKVTKALAMKASGETSAAAQERDALASDQYAQAVDLLFDATVLHETLLATNKAASVLIDVWRSLNSTLKGAKV